MKPISLGRLAGVPLQSNFTAVIIVAWLAMSRSGPNGEHLLDGLFFAVVLFGSILVHELGHALVGRRLGVRPIRILIHGFGGLCEYSRAPIGLQGMAISAAGPAAGLCLAAVAWVLSQTTQGYVPLGLSDWLGEWIWINLFWSLFNLIPMFPLDGGSVVLHGLETGMPPHIALRWTRRMSLVVAAAVAYFGWQSGLTFVTIIALMVLLQNFPHRSEKGG